VLSVWREVWREVRRDERQEPADWRSTREGFVAIKGRAKRFAPTAASASGMFGPRHETVAHFRAGKAIGDGRDRRWPSQFFACSAAREASAAARPAFGPLAERSDALAAERAKAWWRRLRSAGQGGPEDLMDPDRQETSRDASHGRSLPCIPSVAGLARNVAFGSGLTPFAKPSTNGRYLRIPAGWSRRQPDIAVRDGGGGSHVRT
jgi:hypothetical protein